MRSLSPTLLLLACCALVPARASEVTVLETVQGWTAAHFTENGQRVCYAFARPARSEGARNAQNVQLLVTHRPGARDQVAVRVGYALPRNAEMRLVIGNQELPGYTGQDSGFLRNGSAAVAAMRNGREAQSRTPGPNNRGTVTHVFPLAGFSRAHDAITRACPTTPARR
jgi:hypothetical protein